MRKGFKKELCIYMVTRIVVRVSWLTRTPRKELYFVSGSHVSGSHTREIECACAEKGAYPLTFATAAALWQYSSFLTLVPNKKLALIHE